jgi:hypothetical protein
MNMTKKALLLFIFSALGTALCTAQQYFTGTVAYRYNLKGVNPDTVRLQVEYTFNYARITPLSKDLSGEKIEGEIIIDWLASAVYMINTRNREVVKRFFKKGDSQIRTSKDFPDSVTIIAGTKGRLRKVTAKDSIQVDCWLADSLVLPVHHELQNDSDFFLFFMDKLALRIETKYGSKAEVTVNGFREIIMEAEAITFCLPNDTPYQLPAGYKIIDEAEQQRISDSLLREFKTVDSSLSASNKKIDLNEDSLKMIMKQQVDSLRNLKKQTDATLRKLNSPRKKKKDRSKQPARKPKTVL